MNDYPKVSFLIPVKNEVKTLVMCLDSIIRLDYPLDCVEVLLAMYDLNDDTGKVAQLYASRYPGMIRVLNNPTGNTSIGRNICLRNAKGIFVMNFSGHAVAERNLLKVLVSKLKDCPGDVVGVGCSNVSPVDQKFVGESSGVAFRSIMGGGGVFTQNVVYPDERLVEHMSFALYRKDAVVNAGGFDDSFWCGQDYELDVRLRGCGLKIWYSPLTRVYHYKRQSLKGLFNQMYRYGVGRAKIIQKHRDSLKIEHLFGLFFILGLSLVVLLLLCGIFPLYFILLLGIVYVLLSWMTSVLVTRKPLVVLLSPLFYFIIHFAYGLGFIRGWIIKKPFHAGWFCL